MSPKQSFPVEGAVTPAEALRFAAIADEVMRSPLYGARVRAADSSPDAPHIGTLREKRLHAAIKTYLCPDPTCHERLVGDFLSEGDGIEKERPFIGLTAGALPKAEPKRREGRGKARRMVADILTDGRIWEVQTGGFYPLRDKIAWYLAHTPYRVTVVHPIPAVRYLSWIDPKDGSIISRRRSPKRGRVKDVAKELYWVSDFIGDPRFSVRLLLIELEEYRMADGWSRDGKRGSSRYERFPTALLGDVTLATPADYAAYFLPSTLTAPDDGGTPPAPFTAAAYAKATGIRGKATYSTLHLLTSLGLLRETEEKIGRSQGFRAVVEVSEANPSKSPKDS